MKPWLASLLWLVLGTALIAPVARACDGFDYEQDMRWEASALNALSFESDSLVLLTDAGWVNARIPRWALGYVTRLMPGHANALISVRGEGATDALCLHRRFALVLGTEGERGAPVRIARVPGPAWEGELVPSPAGTYVAIQLTEPTPDDPDSEGISSYTIVSVSDRRIVGAMCGSRTDLNTRIART